MNKLLAAVLTGAVMSVGVQPARATDLFTWNNHAAPFTFRFGNDLDMHTLSRVTSDGNLFGLMYIQFTGTTTKDGYRIASHGDCTMGPCTVGWTINGKALAATLLSDSMNDHPLFTLNRVDIPEPGAFTHFHWLGAMPAVGQQTNGYLLQLVAVDRFCFIHHDATSATSGKTCHDNGGVKVDVGIDVASHLNIVPEAPMPTM
jgi:hypothetical protein